MPLQVAIQMDPLTGVNFASDSSIRIAAEAERRGADVYVYEPKDLSWQPGLLSVPARRVRGLNPPTASCSAESPEVIDLGEMDVIWVRQDPPFDLAYIASLHLLELVADRVLVLNNPRSIRDAPEKMLVLRYPELTPPTLITRDRASIAAFREAHRDLILKPLGGHAGHGVFHLGPEDENFASALETLLTVSAEPLIVQRYLPEVREGDRRILLVEGEPVGAFARIPATGESRAAMRTGSQVEKAVLTPRELEICRTIGPALRDMGLLFVGIDVIGGCLTEINVTSPTGIAQVERLEGVNAAALIWDAVEKRLRK